MQFPRPVPGFISIQFQCTGNLFVSPFHWSISRITFQITIHPSTFFLNFTWIPFHIVPPSSPHHQARAQQRADTPSSIALFKFEVVVDAASCYFAIIQYTCHSFIYPFIICQMHKPSSFTHDNFLIGYLHWVEIDVKYLSALAARKPIMILVAAVAEQVNRFVRTRCGECGGKSSQEPRARKCWMLIASDSSWLTECWGLTYLGP